MELKSLNRLTIVVMTAAIAAQLVTQTTYGNRYRDATQRASASCLADRDGVRESGFGVPHPDIRCPIPPMSFGSQALAPADIEFLTPVQDRLLLVAMVEKANSIRVAAMMRKSALGEKYDRILRYLDQLELANVPPELLDILRSILHRIVIEEAPKEVDLDLFRPSIKVRAANLRGLLRQKSPNILKAIRTDAKALIEIITLHQDEVLGEDLRWRQSTVEDQQIIAALSTTIFYEIILLYGNFVANLTQEAPREFVKAATKLVVDRIREHNRKSFGTPNGVPAMTRVAKWGTRFSMVAGAASALYLLMDAANPKGRLSRRQARRRLRWVKKQILADQAALSLLLHRMRETVPGEAFENILIPIGTKLQEFYRSYEALIIELSAMYWRSWEFSLFVPMDLKRQFDMLSDMMRNMRDFRMELDEAARQADQFFGAKVQSSIRELEALLKKEYISNAREFLEEKRSNGLRDAA